MYLVLTRKMEILHKTNSTFLISFFHMGTLYWHSLLLAYWWVRKEQRERKRNEAGLPYFSLSFYVINFSVSSYLGQVRNTSKKGYGRGFWSFMFLRVPLPSFFIQNKLWFTLESMTFHGCLCPCLLHTYLILSQSLLCIVVPQEFCAHGILQMTNMNGAARNSGCILSHASPQVHSPLPMWLHL